MPQEEGSLGGITDDMLSLLKSPLPMEEKKAEPVAVPQLEEKHGITPEMWSIFQTPPPAVTPAAPVPAAAKSVPEETPEEWAARIERQFQRERQAFEPPVERSLPGEVAASIGRGVLGIAKLPFEVAKIVGADVLGSQTAKRTLEPILWKFEEAAQSPLLRPSTSAGKPIELDRILEDPSGVAQQIAENVTNPSFWAAQVPEAALSMVPFFAGNLGARIAGQAFKYGKAIKAIQASEYLSEAEKAAKLADIGEKLARLGTIGGYGAGMAMEATQAEEQLRQYEEESGKRVNWGPRVLAILGTGLVSGSLEALSMERIFFGKHGAPSLEGMVEKLFEGKGGSILARKVLDSIATEGTTEGAQQIVQNAFAKIGYNPDQKLTEGVVESILIGAAVGGLAGNAEIFHEAVRQYAPYLKELKTRAEAERQARLAALPEFMPIYRTTPTAATAEREFIPVPTKAEEAAAQRAEEERVAALPETSPIYRTGPAPGVPMEPLPAGPPPVAPLRGLEADILKEPGPEPTEVPPTKPMDFTGRRPGWPAQTLDLERRLDSLLRLVDEEGDPRAAREIHNLLLAHRAEVEAALTPPQTAQPGMLPVIRRVDELYRRVEETGDVEAARELHHLLVGNRERLTGMTREQLRRLAEQPLAPSAEEVMQVEQTPTIAPTEPSEVPPPAAPPQAPTPPAGEAPSAPTTPPPAIPAAPEVPAEPRIVPETSATETKAVEMPPPEAPPVPSVPEAKAPAKEELSLEDQIEKLKREIDTKKKELAEYVQTPEVQAQDPRRQYKPGDKVWMLMPSVVGFPARIEGVVYKSGDNLRVRITTESVGGAKTTDLFDYRWVKEGEKEFPLPAAIKERKAEIEQLEDRLRKLQDEMPNEFFNRARQSYEAALKEGAKPIDFSKVKEGQVYLGHYDDKYYRVQRVEDDKEYGRYVTLFSEDGRDTITLNDRNPAEYQYYTLVEAPTAAIPKETPPAPSVPEAKTPATGEPPPTPEKTVRDRLFEIMEKDERYSPNLDSNSTLYQTIQRKALMDLRYELKNRDIGLEDLDRPLSEVDNRTPLEKQQGLLALAKEALDTWPNPPNFVKWTIIRMGFDKSADMPSFHGKLPPRMISALRNYVDFMDTFIDPLRVKELATEGINAIGRNKELAVYRDVKQGWGYTIYMPQGYFNFGGDRRGNVDVTFFTLDHLRPEKQKVIQDYYRGLQKYNSLKHSILESARERGENISKDVFMQDKYAIDKILTDYNTLDEFLEDKRVLNETGNVRYNVYGMEIDADLANFIDTYFRMTAYRTKPDRWTKKPEHEPVNVEYGRESVAKTERGTTVKTRYAVVDAGDLVASHDTNLNENPAYPQELQPRERGRAVSQLQVAGILQRLEPEWLGATTKASEGAPIVGPDMLVESGNARTIALQMGYESNHPKVAEYRRWLLDNAETFGLTKEQIDNIKKPILVRIRQSEMSATERRQFVREANEAAVAAMSAVEQARSDAAKLADSDVLALFQPNERGVINTQENIPFIRRFMEVVVGPTELGRYYTKEGEISQEGIARIRNAIFAAAYGDSTALAKLTEDPSDAARNITGALTMVAPRMAMVKREIARGNLYKLDISRNIAEAADIVQSLRERGEPVEAFLRQGNLLREHDPLTLDLVRMLETYKLSRSRLSVVLNEYLNLVEALGSPKQKALLKEVGTVPSKSELLDAAVRKMEVEHGRGKPSDVQQGEAVGGKEPATSVGAEAIEAAQEFRKKFGITKGSQEGVEDVLKLRLSVPPKTPPGEGLSLKEKAAIVLEQFKGLPEEHVYLVLRALPDAAPNEVAAMVQYPELFDKVLRGEMALSDREFQAQRQDEGFQWALPGTGVGGLFEAPPERPAPKVKETPAPKAKETPEAEEKKPAPPVTASKVVIKVGDEEIPFERTTPPPGSPERLKLQQQMEELRNQLDKLGKKMTQLAKKGRSYYSEERVYDRLKYSYDQLERQEETAGDEDMIIKNAQERPFRSLAMLLKYNKYSYEKLTELAAEEFKKRLAPYNMPDEVKQRIADRLAIDLATPYFPSSAKELDQRAKYEYLQYLAGEAIKRLPPDIPNLIRYKDRLQRADSEKEIDEIVQAAEREAKELKLRKAQENSKKLEPQIPELPPKYYLPVFSGNQLPEDHPWVTDGYVLLRKEAISKKALRERLSRPDQSEGKITKKNTDKLLSSMEKGQEMVERGFFPVEKKSDNNFGYVLFTPVGKATPVTGITIKYALLVKNAVAPDKVYLSSNEKFLLFYKGDTLVAATSALTDLADFTPIDLPPAPEVAGGSQSYRMARLEPQAAASQETNITQGMVEAAFPGAEVRRGRFFEGYRVLLPHMEISILPNGDIQIPDIESLRKAGYREEDLKDLHEWVAAGHWRTIPGGGVITIAKGLTPLEAGETLRHETFHAACDLVLSDKERRAILQKYGDWETAASAYEKWIPERRPNTLFQKILDFFRRIYEAFRPTYESVFEKIHRGEVWGRKPREVDVFGLPLRFKVIKEADETIERYRERYLAPSEPAEPRGIVEKARGIKASLTEKAERFYEQVVDKWAAWERLERQALQAGAKVPAGELITTSLSFMRGVEGRVRQALTGQYVYQDKLGFEEKRQADVFTGDELVRKGPSFQVRLEPLRELAHRRGMKTAEVMDDFEVLMVAQRDLELAGEFGNRLPDEIKGVHPEESREVAAALLRKYGDDFKVLQEVSGSLREWSDEAILQPLLQVGIINEEAYQTIKAKNQLYVPFKRLLDETNDYLAAHLGAAGVKGKVLHEIKGSEKQILSPLQTWIELAYKAQWAYARNKVYRAAYMIGQAYEEAGIKELPPKWIPVKPQLKQEIDQALRKDLLKLARELKVDVKVVQTLRGKRLGEFSKMLKEEVSEGLLPEEVAGQIRLRFATTEKTLSHELGHALDNQYDLVGLLIDQGTPEMKRELRRIADQQLGDGPVSKSFKRYVRKKAEQVAEFVNRYITDRESCRALAPEATRVFEQLLNQHISLEPLLTFRPSAQAGLMPFEAKFWARSPLPPEPGCVPYYRDGVRRWLKLPPDLYNAAQNFTPPEMGMLMQIARVPADLLRSGAILVPEFSLGRNPVRDMIQAWVFSRFGFNLLKWFRDAALLVSKNPETLELRRQWEAGGGALATLAESFVAPEKISADYLKGKESKVKYFANPLHALRYASSLLENMTRFSIYKQAREAGLTHAEAIHEARRTTLDFSRAGGHPTVRYLNVIIPFWNAAIQGVDKLATELTGPNRAAVARRLAMLATVSVLLMLHARRDDRYKELDDWERNYFWHLPLGPDLPLIRLPKPFEAGILFGSVPERLVEAALTRSGKGVQSALAAAWEAAMPEFIPTIARPFVEAKANYDFFRGRPIEDVGQQRLPAGLRAKPWTTETAKAIGRLTDISPIQLEHFIRQWTGGLGANYFLPGIDLLLKKTGAIEDIAPPEREKIQQLWGVRAFFSQTPTGWRAKSVNDFFERHQEAQLADQGWKELWKQGKMAEVDKYLREHPEAMFARVSRQALAEMTKLRQQREQIYASKSLTPQEKKEKLDKLDSQVLAIARRANLFMDLDAAEKVGMPRRTTVPGKGGKALEPQQYYEVVAGATERAYRRLLPSLPRWEDLEPAERQQRIARAIREERNRPVDLSKLRFGSIWDRPTKAEREAGYEQFGGLKLPTPFLTGGRLRPLEAILSQ